MVCKRPPFKMLAVASAILTCQVYAQETTQENEKNKNAGLERISVTAQKRTQSVQEVPISISAYTGDMLSDMGLVESQQLGQFIPGLEISTSGGEGTQLIVFMRGAGLNDFNSNNSGPIGIYSDEVYISSPALTAFQFFDTQRLEVLKGPQGTLYGRNTTGGAIKFITNKPTEDFEASVKASYASFDTSAVEAAISGPLAENINGRLAFVKNDSDGYAENLVDGGDVSGTDTLSYRGMLEFDYDDLNILVNLHGTEVNSPITRFSPLGATTDGSTPCSTEMVLANQCVDVFGYRAPDDPHEGNYNDMDDIDMSATGGYVQIDYDFGDVIFTSVTSYDEVDRILPEETDASPSNYATATYNVESETFAQEFRVTGTTEKTEWLAGLFYLSESLDQDQTIDLFNDLRAFTGGLSDPEGTVTGAPIFLSRTLNEQDLESYAVFGQSTYAVNDKLNITLGLRYTDEQRDFSALTGLEDEAVFGPDLFVLYDEPDLSADSRAVSYRVAVDYRINENMMTFASVSKGYKSGGFNGGFLSIDATEAALQLEAYDPEYLTAYEVGFKSDLLDNRLRLNASVFYNDFKDSQVFTLVQTETLPLITLDNASNARVYGLEFDATAMVTDGLTVALSGAFLDSELQDFESTEGVDYSGNKIANTPDTSLSGIIRYEYFTGNDASISAQTAISYKSDVFFSTENNPIVGQHSYTIVNARVAYATAEGDWEVAAFVTNLTDKNYQTNVFDLTELGGMYQRTFAPPRQFGIEVIAKFE